MMLNVIIAVEYYENWEKRLQYLLRIQKKISFYQFILIGKMCLYMHVSTDVEINLDTPYECF